MATRKKQSAVAKKYMSLLRRLSNCRGRKCSTIKKKAMAMRVRMISANPQLRLLDIFERGKPGANDLLKHAPAKYKKFLAEYKSLPKGKMGLKLASKFWGLTLPPKIFKATLPGPKSKKIALVGLGTSPEVHISTTPSGNKGKTIVLIGQRHVTSDPSGRRIFVFSKKPKSKTKQFYKAGWAKMTQYIPPKDIEKAGSKKAGRWWNHDHLDQKGKWPEIWTDTKKYSLENLEKLGNKHIPFKTIDGMIQADQVFKDSSASFFYSPGTYRVKAWIER